MLVNIDDQSSSTQVDPTERSLAAERTNICAIEAAFARQRADAQAMASRLAAQAAESTEEGIRDVVDSDAESDAAIAAAMVRQLSDRAMHAAKRAHDLEQRGEALAFGHFTTDEGERWYVGRHSVIEADRVFLVDWRAEVAIPFYRATPIQSLGVVQRRHFHYEAGELVDYSDDVLDAAKGSTGERLRGEAALLESLTEPTQDHMKSVVATIQTEQDLAIRAPAHRPLIIQGGPGTGKTVVALHRAAYLLYNKRVELADTGVLLIGPSNQFLRYIQWVLPSLGETGVVAITPAELYRGVRRGFVDDSRVAALKGQLRMARFLVAGLADRRRVPQSDLEVWYGSTRVVLKVAELQKVFALANRALAHNTGARRFADLLNERLFAEVYHPSFDNRSDAKASFRRSRSVRECLLAHFPPLTPEQFLNDLLGSRALLRSAARQSEVTVDEANLLYRPRCSEAELAQRSWSLADLPLLDEALSLLQGSTGGEVEVDRLVERDAASEFEQAAAVDKGIDLAHYDSGEEVPATELGLTEADYDGAEAERTRRLEPAPEIHPKFQERLEKRERESEIG